MKKILAIGILGLAMILNVKGQGQVDFRNSNVPGSQFVLDFDGTKLAGPSFVAQLYYSTTANGVFTSVTDPAAPFRAVGAGDGFWNPGASSTRNLTGTIGGQTVFLQVRAWSAAAGTYETALTTGGAHVGSSSVFSYVTGGDPQNGNPSITAPAMTGFQGFSLSVVPVPEPSTIALGVLGAGSLLFLRRKK